MANVDLPEGASHAWVCFDGGGTPAILDSYNVSSIDDDATGNWGVNFSMTMADSDYPVLINGDDINGADVHCHYELGGPSRTTTACDVHCWGLFGEAFVDADYVSVVALGDAASGTDRDLPQQVALAWVAATTSGGTITLEDSENVTSITDDGVGTYQINITSAANDDYAALMLSDDNGFAQDCSAYENSTVANVRTSSAIHMLSWDNIGLDWADTPQFSVVLYGDVPSATARDLPRLSAKVWGLWDTVSGTPTLRNSHNITSLTDYAVGITSVNITNALSAATDYAMVGNGDGNAGAHPTWHMETTGGGNGGSVPRTTTRFTLRTYDPVIGTANTDTSAVGVVAYGDLA